MAVPDLISACDSFNFPCRCGKSKVFFSIACLNLCAQEITGDIRLFFLQILHIFAYLYMHNFTRNSPTVFKALLCVSLSVQAWSLRRLSKGETFSQRVTTLVFIQILYQVVCHIIKIAQFRNNCGCCFEKHAIAQGTSKMSE